MEMPTLSQKRAIGAYLRACSVRVDGRNVRFSADGGATIMVDAMPNTGIPGRMWAGYAHDLLREMERGQY